MNGVLLSNWFLIRRCDSHASTFRYDPIRLIELFYILLLIPFFYFYSLVTTSYHAITRFAKELISFQGNSDPDVSWIFEFSLGLALKYNFGADK